MWTSVLNSLVDEWIGYLTPIYKKIWRLEKGIKSTTNDHAGHAINSNTPKHGIWLEKSDYEVRLSWHAAGSLRPGFSTLPSGFCSFNLCVQ
jgi:hypothetical protein